jgi:hypothetical protein
MINRHQLIKYIKNVIFGGVEGYSFNNQRLVFSVGSRPIKRKFINSENDVVRNDVLQIEYFEKHFNEEDILWDIGSHCGHYSIFCASIAKGNNQIFSFEPDAAARNIQKKNI